MDKSKITIQTYNKFARRYQDKFMDLDSYNDSYKLFCQLIDNEDAEILELACGPGNITKYLLNKHPTYKILATDLSYKMLELAKVNNPTAKFNLMDCRDLCKIEKKYNAIINGFGLPYISKIEVEKFIKDSSKILNPNGVIYLSVMEGYYKNSGFKGSSSGGKERVYIYYYQEEFINNTLKKNGFSISKVQRINYLEQKNNYDSDLIIIAKKI